MGVSSISGCNLVSEAVRAVGRVRLRVSGTSMVPSMRPGDLITVERAGTAEIAPGEIVVFARAGRLVVHRVTGITAGPGCREIGRPRRASRFSRLAETVRGGRIRLFAIPNCWGA